MADEKQLTLEERINTEGLRPWSRLPFPKPSEFDPEPEYFHNNFVQPLIPDMIKLMCTGIRVDEEAVESLRGTVTTVLNNVDSTLLRNKYIQEYQIVRSKKAQKTHYAKHTENTRAPSHFYKDYDNSVIHRTWLVNTYLTSKGYTEDLKDSWTVRDLKNYNVFKDDMFLSRVVDKSFAPKSKIVIKAMEELAKYKSELWNIPRYDKANSKAPAEPFNPGSAKQKQELFAMLKIAPLAFSDDTGDASYGREVIEAMLKEVNSMLDPTQ